MNTYGISSRKINSAMAKRRCGFVTDQRGKNKNSTSNKISASRETEIIDHINSFPRYKSHYTRHHSQREYFNPSLNINVMYDLYKQIVENLLASQNTKAYFTRNSISDLKQLRRIL